MPPRAAYAFEALITFQGVCFSSVGGSDRGHDRGWLHPQHRRGRLQLKGRFPKGK